jgi:hypothetical protein
MPVKLLGQVTQFLRRMPQNFATTRTHQRTNWYLVPAGYVLIITLNPDLEGGARNVKSRS